MLKGTQIPLVSRVLSVADCFEALTCDRPYRPSCNREKAMEIVRSRSGTFYDPEVVEKFDQILDGLIAEVQDIEARELKVERLKAISQAARSSESITNKPLRN